MPNQIRKANKLHRRLRYDLPKTGYRRWTAHVSIKLLEEFKTIAEQEGKSHAAALEEALKNWCGHEE